VDALRQHPLGQACSFWALENLGLAGRTEGTFRPPAGSADDCKKGELQTPIEELPMNGLIYIVGLIVIIMFILSFLGLR
jgi:hypothetical protein